MRTLLALALIPILSGANLPPGSFNSGPQSMYAGAQAPLSTVRPIDAITFKRGTDWYDTIRVYSPKLSPGQQVSIGYQLVLGPTGSDAGVVYKNYLVGKNGAVYIENEYRPVPGYYCEVWVRGAGGPEDQIATAVKRETPIPTFPDGRVVPPVGGPRELPKSTVRPIDATHTSGVTFTTITVTSEATDWKPGASFELATADNGDYVFGGWQKREVGKDKTIKLQVLNPMGVRLPVVRLRNVGDAVPLNWDIRVSKPAAQVGFPRP